MKNLLEIAIASTEKNIVKKTSRKSINDCLLELLLKKEMSKTACIAQMSLDRLQAKHSDVEHTEKWFKSDDIQKEYKSINVTVKNGFEASVCNGHTNASFSHNPRFAKYDLQKLDNGNYTIVEKK